jgi:hypothetical protein
MREPREIRRVKARLYWAGFWKCPTTDRICEQSPGDDKVLCTCRRPNPRVPTEYPGVHIVTFLEPATVDEWLDQQDRLYPEP